MLLLTPQKAIPTRPGGQNIVQYFDLPSNNPLQSFVFVSYLLDKIYHIKMISMMSWLLNSYTAFIDTTKCYPTRPGGQNIIWCFDTPLDILSPPPPPPPPQISDDIVLFVFHIYKVLFAIHICLITIRSINVLTSLMISWVVLLLLIFTLPKTSPTQPGVVFHIYLRRCIIISKWY